MSTNAQRLAAKAESRVLAVVREQPGFSAYILSQRLRWTTAYTEETLQRLALDGAVEAREGTSPITGYPVTRWWPTLTDGDGEKETAR